MCVASESKRKGRVVPNLFFTFTFTFSMGLHGQSPSLTSRDRLEGAHMSRRSDRLTHTQKKYTPAHLGNGGTRLAYQCIDVAASGAPLSLSVSDPHTMPLPLALAPSRPPLPTRASPPSLAPSSPLVKRARRRLREA